jgi:hypothetical protein
MPSPARPIILLLRVRDPFSPEPDRFGNITYWVATPATADAKPARSEPISIKIIPLVAPKDIVRAESNRILHLSDLHVAPGKHAFAVGG